MRYPVVNLRALGAAGLFPQQPAYAPPPRSLGQAEAASLQAAAAELRTAQDVMDRVTRSYPGLVATMGEDGAKEAWYQAQDSLDAAKKKYEEALKYSQGGRA